MSRQLNPLKIILTAAVCGVCLFLTAALLKPLLFPSDNAEISNVCKDARIMDSYDSYISGIVSNAAAAASSVKPVFQIEDGATVCPEPNQSCYGETDDPSSLQWLLDEASEILDGQDTLFRTDLELMPGTKVIYYLDESIFAITWKQVFDDFAYTISEVKIAHASQFRRYLAGNEYGSKTYHTTTEMADMVNAVVASSGDFYRNRKNGIVVYNGKVEQVLTPELVDTCFVDEKGELIFSYRGELTSVEDAQRFVDEHNISFSISFGPILVDNGVRCEPEQYALGEVNNCYPRASLGQRGELHYIVTVANYDGPYKNYPTIHTFAKYVAEFGCEKVYTLDGGQTGVIAMNNQCINKVQFGEQRRISDIFYFATALPERE